MEKSNSSVGILGYGEIGKAIAEFYENPKIKDLDRDDGLQGVDILHVCIPWSEQFVEIVGGEIEQTRPGVTIVHSTVAPGTTKKLSDGIGRMVVHSPVRGIHPHLYEGIKTFVKYIGVDNEEAGELAKKHLEGLGIQAKIMMPSVTTEVGKLFSTTYYGLCIAWHGEMKKICDELGVSFEQAATDFNKTYNEGYTKLGKENVVRPTLIAPEDGIGGHCIVQNVDLLKRDFESEVFDLIMKYRDKNNMNVDGKNSDT